MQFKYSWFFIAKRFWVFHVLIFLQKRKQGRRESDTVELEIKFDCESRSRAAH